MQTRTIHDTVEGRRLAEARADTAAWKRWGPYLSDRQWGTVREDYSAGGTAWDYFPHDHARSRAYRWGEDGIGGLSDDQQVLCFALALWNGRDPILKERFFGLTGSEGNHGEDVKEYYFYLDATPTGSYLRMLYKYPQAAFPYDDLVYANRNRGKVEPEYELVDTGIFDDSRYFDVVVEYAKAGPDDILIRISATNRGPEPAALHLLPTLWYRNTWAWGGSDATPRPLLRRAESGPTMGGSRADGLGAGSQGAGGDGDCPVAVVAEHPTLGTYRLACEDTPDLLFTENDSNQHRLFGCDNASPYLKDSIHEAVVNRRPDAVNPAQVGTKAAAHYQFMVAAGATEAIRLRLTRTDRPDTGDVDVALEPETALRFPVVHGSHPEADGAPLPHPGQHIPDLAFDGTVDEAVDDSTAGGDHGMSRNGLGPGGQDARQDGRRDPDGVWFMDVFADFDAIFAARIRDADDFFDAVHPAALSADERLLQRQALAGLVWSKQLFYFDVDRWLTGDPSQPAPPEERKAGRNREWRHFNAADIMSMPDAWEYPWFAAWDLAFHCLPFALIDPDFAKEQLVLLGREWFQHPNGQVPAYEWAFGDVNPPVLAWAAWRVYKIDQRRSGRGDREFLERVFHKQMLNFTWWVNRKDSEGNNVFEGGFLGLDNIGVFDRSAPLPTGGHIEQSDGTSWMGMFCLNMMTIAMELATENRAYESIAIKFFEHFMYIAQAINEIGSSGIPLWDEEDEFFYDVLHTGSGDAFPMKIRSMVGLIPLFAVTTIEPDRLAQLPELRARLEWFLEHKPQMARLVSRWQEPGLGERRLLAIARGHRMKRVLRRMLDETEMLSRHGVRALSKHHQIYPYSLEVSGMHYTVEYQPAESNSGLFGGNSNWRGPVWFPVNYLIVESLQQFHHYYGDDFTVECPTGSGTFLTLDEVAMELARRLSRTFLLDEHGRRPVFGNQELFQANPHWRDLIPFYEYFHGDTGRGVGASHQTGWTALVAKLLDTEGRHRPPVPSPGLQERESTRA